MGPDTRIVSAGGTRVAHNLPDHVDPAGSHEGVLRNGSLQKNLSPGSHQIAINISGHDHVTGCGI